MRTSRIVITLFTLALWSAACASAPQRVGATPRLEAGVGFVGPQLPSAEFPGVTGSLAFNLTKSPRWGVAAVADAEGAYLMQTVAAGPRVYGRSGPLFSEHRTVSYFTQLLLGKATGGVEGVLRSEGGPVVEPGVGLDYGTGRYAFRLQISYRHVEDGVVYDSRVPGQPTDKLSGTRVVIGMTLRLLPH